MIIRQNPVFLAQVLILSFQLNQNLNIQMNHQWKCRLQLPVLPCVIPPPVMNRVKGFSEHLVIIHLGTPAICSSFKKCPQNCHCLQFYPHFFSWIKTANGGSSMDTCQNSKPWQFYGHFSEFMCIVKIIRNYHSGVSQVRLVRLGQLCYVSQVRLVRSCQLGQISKLCKVGLSSQVRLVSLGCS